MKTREPPPENQGKAGEKDQPVNRFKRAATVIMTTSRTSVKALEAAEARRRLKAKKKARDE